MNTKLRIAAIKSGSFADGPGGPRTVMWLQGCSIRCAHCQNKRLWAADGPAVEHSPAVAANVLLDMADQQPLTITGGEPLDQAEALAETLRHIRRLDPKRHIIVYTGYEWDHILSAMTLKEDWMSITPCAARRIDSLNAIVRLTDVLVDGPYEPELDDPMMQWRGSSNQRAVDLRATRIKDDWSDPVILDWDTPTVEIDGDEAHATGGLFAYLGVDAERTPRCGEATDG